jgi:hypothetical protein
MLVFQDNDPSLRAISRQLDLFAYGLYIEKRAVEISRGFWKEVGDQEAGDVVETAKEE